MADDRTIRVRLQAEITSYREGLKQAATATEEFGRNVAGIGEAVTADIEKVGRSALVMAAGLSAGLGLSAKAAIDWESSWVGVAKTVDGTAEQMDALEGSLRRMATELPASHGEIARVAQVAGQLGVAVPDITEFSRVMIGLGEATEDLAAEDAAMQLARFMNIMGSSHGEVERLASSLVWLGNNASATEGEILHMATRIAGAGNEIGMTEADVMGLSAALVSVGIRAEMGGTAISRVMLGIAGDVATNSDRLAQFAEISGMAVADFSKAWKEDAAGALGIFLEGLANAEAQGKTTFGVIDELNLGELRVRDTLLRSSNARDLYNQYLEGSRRAYEENIALQEEVEKRYASTASQLKVLGNQVKDVGIDLGEVMLPAIRGTVGVLGNMVAGFSQLPGPVQTVGVGLAGVATAGLGLVGVVGTLTPKVESAVKSLENMGTAGKFMARNIGDIGKGLGVVSLGFAAFSMWQGLMENARRSAQEFGLEIRGILDQKQGYDELTEAVGRLAGQQRKLLDDQARSINPFDVVYRAELGEGAKQLGQIEESYTALIQRVDQLSAATGIQKDEALALIRTQDRLALSANDDSVALERLQASMDPTQAAALAAELGVTTDQLDIMTGSVRNAATELDELYAAMRRVADAPMSRRVAELDLADALDAVQAAQDALNGKGAAGIRISDDAASSAKRLEDANRRVADSQRSVADAEELVAEKREKLRKIMEGYGEGSEEATTAEEREAKAKRDVERARLALAAAEARLRDPKLDSDQRRSAELDVADARDRVRDASRDATKAQEELNDALHGADPASKKAVDATKDLQSAERTLEGALRSQQDALRAVDEAAKTRARGFAGSAQAVKTQEELERNLERALIDLEERYRDVAIVEAEHRIALAESAGETLTAADKQKILVEELRKVAAGLDKDSVLRRNLEDYILDLWRIPTKISTEIELDEAALKRTNDTLKAINDAMAGTGRTFGSVMHQSAAPFMGPRLIEGRAAGGPIRANTAYLVGEEGPELIVSNTSGFVAPNHELSGLMAPPPSRAATSGGGGNRDVILNVNVDGAAFGPGDVDALAEVVVRKVGWQLSIQGGDF